jgi:hypothetical protein
MRTAFKYVLSVVFTSSLLHCNDSNFASFSSGSQRTSQDATPDKSFKLEQEFQIADHLKHSMKFQKDTSLVNQSFTMNKLTESKRNSTNAAGRPSYTEVFMQGQPGVTTTETFNQASAGVLDLVIVIDNSGSMGNEQTNLAARMQPLLSAVAASDWQMRIVTTDPGASFHRAIIKKGESDINTRFEAAIKAGLAGDGNEQGIRTATMALDNYNGSPWIRPNSNIAVLIVSDEDNCSNGSSCGGAAWGNQSHLLSRLETLRPGGNRTKYSVHGIYWVPGTPQGTAAYVANQYHAAVTATGGAYGSISDTDYTATLNRISSDIAETLQTQFSLMQVPDGLSFTLSINGTPTTTGFTRSGRVITFTTVPPYNATVAINYSYGDVPRFTKKVLPQPAVAQGMSVKINNVALAASGFSFNATTNEIIFTSQPADRAEISVSYRGNTPLQQNFPLNDSDIIPSSVQVKINGSVTGSADYSYNNSTRVVRLNSPLVDGGTVLIEYSKVLGPKLNYSIVVPEESQDTLEVIDETTKESINHQYKDGVISFATADYVDQRKVRASYRRINKSLSELNIGVDADPDTITIKHGDITCTGEQVQVVDKHIVLGDCQLGSSDKAIEVNFEQKLEIQKSFELADKRLVDCEDCVYTVSINGKETGKYNLKETKKGAIIALASELAHGDVVVITATNILD